MKRKEIPKKILKKYGVEEDARDIPYSKRKRKISSKTTGFVLTIISGLVLIFSILSLNLFVMAIGLIILGVATHYFKKRS